MLVRSGIEAAEQWLGRRVSFAEAILVGGSGPPSGQSRRFVNTLALAERTVKKAYMQRIKLAARPTQWRGRIIMVVLRSV